MRFLFDTSAILNSIRYHHEDIVDFIERNECYTLSLAQYEIGNALWKEAYLLKRISVNDALKTFNFVNALLNLMRIVDLSRYEVEVLLLSIQIGLTFYDTSYISIAKNLNCNLVTDDDELIKISEKLEVKTIKSMDLPIKS
ncbi:MAG: type II toxin-antitoxin system VapC family toxin [Candidatus Geothermarchaeota archaeon]